jgi:plasmid stabilization system protein ParE
MHEVILTDRAQDELDRSHDWWAENRSPQQADRWYVGFVKEMLTLEENPERCPLAPENELFPYEVRQLNYGLGARPTHRALYTVRLKEVVILRVRHHAQRPLTVDDV